MARLWGGRSAGPSALGLEVVPTGFGFAAGSVVDMASALAALVRASAGAVRSGQVAVSLGGFAALPIISPPMPPGVDAHTGGSGVGSVLVDGHLVHLPGIEVQLLEVLVAQPSRAASWRSTRLSRASGSAPPEPFASPDTSDAASWSARCAHR